MINLNDAFIQFKVYHSRSPLITADSWKEIDKALQAFPAIEESSMLQGYYVAEGDRMLEYIQPGCEPFDNMEFIKEQASTRLQNSLNL